MQVSRDGVRIHGSESLYEYKINDGEVLIYED